MPLSPRLLAVLVVLVVLVVAEPARADQIAVNLSTTKAWCVERSIPIGTDNLAEPAVEQRVDQAKEDGLSELDRTLAEHAIFYSGLPFVAGAATVATPPAPGTAAPAPAAANTPAPPPQNFVFDVCAVVATFDPATVPPAIKLMTLPAASYTALDCDALSGDDCLAQLRKGMIETFGAAKADAVTLSPILEAQAAEPITSATIATAWAAARDRATWHALSFSANTAAVINTGDISERPLALNDKAGIVVGGTPAGGRKVLLIRNPD